MGLRKIYEIKKLKLRGQDNELTSLAESINVASQYVTSRSSIYHEEILESSSESI